MRNRPLFALALALVLVALSAAACGGGLEATTTNDIFDTGAFTDTGVVEPPPVEPTPPAQPEIIVLEVSAGQPIGPQSPAEQVSELQRALVALGFKVGKADGIYGCEDTQGRRQVPEGAQDQGRRPRRPEDGERDEQRARKARLICRPAAAMELGFARAA